MRLLLVAPLIAFAPPAGSLGRLLGVLMVPGVVLVSALAVSAAAEVVLLLVAAAEVLAGAEAVAEAVAEADALADAEELVPELVPELPLQAARPRAPAMVRDRTAIDFFTDFLFSVCAALQRRSA
jgi:hypothetical protein